MRRPEIICFDADDTLWVNETFYQDIEKDFIELMARYADRKIISDDIHRREVDNLEIYGYGAKGFMLSMIEAALEISKGKVSSEDLNRIIEMGRGLINEDIILLDGVEDTLKTLSDAGYKLIVATKGDLLDQERKLRKSGLAQYFDHIEIMSFKREEDYRKLLHNLGVEPFDFLMVGNSMKSDILPVLEIGGNGIHIPFHTTWAHELVENTKNLPNFVEIEDIREMLDLIDL
ncbi:MAG: HAD family hydrolase [Clostridia bacterium]|nr:HAD family hydrolase [Clostridia bacterium]MBN2883338.1 HAD family hydrolase [Clostridia bacterium]